MQIVIIIIVMLLYGAGRVGYFYGGTLGAWISCIVAIVLPVGTFLAYISSIEVPTRKQQSTTTGADSQSHDAESSTQYRHARQSTSFHKPLYGSGGDTKKIFLRCLSGLMAKMAKADGHVDKSEISVAESVFVRLGLSSAQRELCITAFREALASSCDAGFYASILVFTFKNLEVRRVIYEILWDIACADGRISPEEKMMLRGIALQLKLGDSLFYKFYSERIGFKSGGDGKRSHTSTSHKSELQAAYDELGCSCDASDDELRAKYRNLAKKLHPDILRAQGMPESLMGRANERMAKINMAWKTILRARNIK